MQLQLSGKTAFLTGATSGIGFATAQALAKEGANVLLHGRTAEKLQKAIQRIRRQSPKVSVSGFLADFNKPDQVTTLLEQLPGLDILINNVGIFTPGSFFDTRDADWYRQFEVNVMGGVRLSRKLLPQMLDRDWGRIVFVSSECATLVPPDMIAYGMTKAAILAVSRGLAQLTKGTGVTVNTIVPGSTLSEGAERFLEQVAKKDHKTKGQVEEEFFSRVRTSSLLQRFASVEEVANTIVYFASPLASATNGAAIKVDGGSMGGIL